MGCCHSLTAFINFLQNPHSPSSGRTNNRSPTISINGDTDDTIPLTSSKNNKGRDLIKKNEKNFSRVIPLLEERDPSSTFANVNDQRRLSNISIKSQSSSSSITSLENGISNSIKENQFQAQDRDIEKSDLNPNSVQKSNSNSPNKENSNINHMSSHRSAEINLLYNRDELMMSTEDEGGISGEMDSSFDDT